MEKQPIYSPDEVVYQNILLTEMCVLHEELAEKRGTPDERPLRDAIKKTIQELNNALDNPISKQNQLKTNKKQPQ